MRNTIITIKEGCISKEAEEKLKAMRMVGINISAFIEWAIMNFNIETYQKVMNCEQF